MSSLFGELSAITIAFTVLMGLLGIFAAMALVRPQLHQGAAVAGRDLLRPQAARSSTSTGHAPQVGFRVVRGGAALRVPVLEQVAYLSLNIISIPLKIHRAYTKEGVPVTVEAVANVKIAGDDMSLRSAAERFLGMTVEQIKGVIFQTLEGHLRAILGTLTVEEINADRQAFAQKMTDEAAVDLKKMGVNIDILTIQQISDERGLPRCARQEAHRRGQARRGDRRGARAARRDDPVGERRPGRQDQALRGRRDHRAVAARQGDAAGRVRRGGPGEAGRGASRRARSPPPSPSSRSPSRRPASTRCARRRRSSSRSRKRCARRRNCRRPSSSRPRPSARRRSCAPRAQKQATIIKAEATQKELEYEGAGEAAKIEQVGRAEAAKVLAIGEAEAEVIKKKLLAEAEGLQRKSEAWKNFNEAAVLNMLVEKMPELAQAFATQLAGIDKINIIEMGNGAGGSGGIGKVMGTVGGGMTAMLAMLKDQFGIDVVRLARAKTDAATTEAEARPLAGDSPTAS